MSDSEPEVQVVGPGDPVAVVVGGIHGDEPSGVRAIERLRDREFERAVKLVVANPAAIEADERGLEGDLNRSFPGDLDGNHEQRLAARLCGVTGDLPTLSIHSTHSQPDPFALVDHEQQRAVELASQLPVSHVVDHREATDGTFTACGQVVTVEAGSQHSAAAADHATHLAEAFLRLVGALPGDPPTGTPDYFRLLDAVEKPPDADYELLVENFERVPAGTTWARADDETYVASEPFYPILMSECGYEDVFGYRGERLGDDPADVVQAGR